MYQANGSHYQNGDSFLVSNGKSVKECKSRDVAVLTSQEKDSVRLIGQYLRSLGLEQTAKTLVEESGLSLEHPVAARFRNHVLAGHWNNADSDLADLNKLLKEDDKTIRKYLELLEDGKVLDAVHCLRHEITPLKFNTHRVHQLSIYMMCDSATDLREASDWPGKGAQSRHALMEKLQGFLPAHVMLPPRRMQELIKQALTYQIQQCHFHNTKEEIMSSISLLSDHSCPKFQGRYGFIWRINPITKSFKLEHQLEGHNYGVAYIAWSPDSKYLIACGPDECADLWLWDCQTGELKTRMTHSTEDSLTSAAFHADGKRFVTGGTRGQFYQCATCLNSWEGVRVQCVGCLNDNKTVLAADSHYRLRSYNLDDGADQHLLQESHAIVSFTVSDDGRLALLNVDSEGIHIWDLKDKCLVRKLQGIKHGFYAIHSCFGGVNQDFVTSGSEDNMVYIWHKREETPISVLKGHTSTVNCVHWNPVDPSMDSQCL